MSRLRWPGFGLAALLTVTEHSLCLAAPLPDSQAEITQLRAVDVRPQGFVRDANPIDWLGEFSPQFVARRQLRDGAMQDIYRFVAATPSQHLYDILYARSQALDTISKVLVHPVGQWQVFSFWRHQRLTAIQLQAVSRDRTEGLVTVTELAPPTQQRLGRHARTAGAGFDDSRAVDGAPVGMAGPAPQWWPRLQQAWQQSWLDDGRRVTTLMGWLPGGVPDAVKTLTRAAAIPAMRLVSRSVSPGNANGILLVFAGEGNELMVTLTVQGARTGVVAHYSEESS